MQWWLAYLAIGLAVGFFAGLLGIGGGAVMVPLLVLVFGAQALPSDQVVHLALGTSMASIAFTSISSMRAHHAHGAVDWAIARAMAPGILAGSFCAALLAGIIPRRPLALMFTAVVFYAATQVLLDLRPKRSRELPGGLGLFTAGATIGGIASLVAAGGAFLCIPFLAWCRVPLRRAIGTAAAIGLPIALAGTLGYVVQGLRAEGLPSLTLGYVYLPALVLVVATSMAAAPLGARIAHRLPVRQLRIIFALLLYVLALRMLVSVW
ncbi:MAG TPA: sulfite exporter TauE/SafE family protein [Burkholderiales bacterium]